MKEDKNSSTAKRRSVLKAAGVAGASTAMFSLPVSADSSDVTKIGEIIFSEIGLRYKNSGIHTKAIIDPLVRYRVNTEDGNIIFALLEEEEQKLIENNESIAHHQELIALPDVVNKGKESLSIPLSTNQHGHTQRFAQLSKEVQFPAVRVKSTQHDSIQIAHKNISKTAKPGEEKSLEISQESVNLQEGETEQVKPTYTLKNYGSLEVYIKEVL